MDAKELLAVCFFVGLLFVPYISVSGDSPAPPPRSDVVVCHDCATELPSPQPPRRTSWAGLRVVSEE